MATNEHIKFARQGELEYFENRLFQRNYYEHIIRNEEELNKIREYIRLNPLMWDKDKNNPMNFVLSS
jgi:putative transposase